MSRAFIKPMSFVKPINTAFHPARMRTGFLFPTPGFLSGIGSVLNVFGKPGLYNYSRTGEEADFKALYSDYRMIGQDIEDAMGIFEDEHAQALDGQIRLFDPDKTARAS